MQINSHFYYKSKNLRIKSLRDNNMSHHSMATFFSGTDTNTLQEEGSDRNNFVSLIVNNIGSYTAAITRKVTHTMTIHDTTSYNFFDSDPVVTEQDIRYEIKTGVEYFYLNISIEGSHVAPQSFTDRILEIKKRKEESRVHGIDSSCIKYDSNGQAFYNPPVKSSTWNNVGMTIKDSKYDIFGNFISGDNMSTELDLDRIMEDNISAVNEKRTHDIDDYCFSKKTVDWIVRKLISCSLFIDEKTVFDPRDKIKGLKKLVTKVFGNPDADIKFEEFAETMCSILICGREDTSLKKAGLTRLQMESILARDVYNRLLKLSEGIRNDYIDIYLQALEGYFDSQLDFN